MGRLVEEMFAFIVVDADGNEGIPSLSQDGYVFPFIGTDLQRMASLKATIVKDPRLAGHRITLARFGKRDNLIVVDRSSEDDGSGEDPAA